MPATYQVALVGAGYVSDVHAEALQNVPDVAVRAVVDPSGVRAKMLAKRFGIAHTFPDVDSLIREGGCNVAHVLVPPPLHRAVGERLLQAGLHVLLEKPMATSLADCVALAQTAKTQGTRLGVNQNQVYHPGMTTLRAGLRTLGRLHHVVATFNVALRQLADRQFAHWMFQAPQNILLEQAVHPLSQIVSLIGEVEEVSVLANPPRSIAPGLSFYDTWSISLRGRTTTAQLFFSVGQDFPNWTLRCICSDGAGFVDMLTNRVVLTRRSRWPDFGDSLLTGLATGVAQQRQGIGNALEYVASRLKLRGRRDTFFLGMRDSVAAFYRALRTGEPALDGAFGASLVELCERIARAGGVDAGIGSVTVTPRRVDAPALECDVAVLGGTGFIGTNLVRKLVAAGHRVSVLARNTAGLPEVFSDPAVRVRSGDVGVRDDDVAAIGSAKIVINLAIGASGTTPQDIISGIRDAARVVGEVCLEGGVSRLVHVSTIAALYLGRNDEIVTGGTPADPLTTERSVYSRGKAEAEQALLELHRHHGLPVCVIRPGLVIGDGASPFHGGVGFYNNDQHCMGWNRGDNPLPFVLVDDVADALLRAGTAVGVDGHCYNLVGDCRLTAREYVAELGRVLGRPLKFHANSPTKMALIEGAKWLLKIATGSRDVVRPTYRDLRSRGLTAGFDCSDAKTALDWTPVANRDDFIALGIEIHRRI